MFKVYQIVLSNADVENINKSTQPITEFPIYAAYCKASLGDVIKGIEGGFYSYVGDIDTDDLEDAFFISNTCVESKINRIGNMTSLSVGNILADENDECFVVKSFGFEKLLESVKIS